MLDAGELRELCLRAGADDVGFASLAAPALAGERPHIEAAFPGARTAIAIAVRIKPARIDGWIRISHPLLHTVIVRVRPVGAGHWHGLENHSRQRKALHHGGPWRAADAG